MTDTNISVPGSLIKLTETECHDLLHETTLGRIAFVNAEGQQLIPVNFIYVDGLIYFRTAYSSMLSSLAQGHDDVAFGAEKSEDATHRGWNVTVRGSARRVEDRATINKILGNLDLVPWAGGVRSTVIEVRPRFFAGRRI